MDEPRAEELVDSRANGVLDIFLSQGVLGALVVVLLYAVYRQNKHLHEIQEKRVELAMKVTSAADATVETLDRNTEALERNTAAIQRLEDKS